MPQPANKPAAPLFHVISSCEWHTGPVFNGDGRTPWVGTKQEAEAFAARLRSHKPSEYVLLVATFSIAPAEPIQVFIPASPCDDRIEASSARSAPTRGVRAEIASLPTAELRRRLQQAAASKREATGGAAPRVRTDLIQRELFERGTPAGMVPCQQRAVA